METDSYEQYSRKRAHDTNDGYDNYKRPTNPSSSGKPTLKFLVPNFMAGKLIGKGGSNIGELQTKFCAFIQVSGNGDYYPGTTYRIVSVCAEISDIMEFTNYLSDVVDEEERSERKNPELRPEIQFVVSNISAGLVIGKGGASIKAIQQSSNGAKISLSSKEDSIHGERVIKVSGNVASRSLACKQIVETMGAEPDKMSNATLSYLTNNTKHNHPPSQHPPPPSAPGFNHHHHPQSNYNNLASIANVLSNAMSAMGNQGAGPPGGNYVPKSGAKAKFQCEIEMPEKLAGTIFGKGGQTIHALSRNSGARLQFSSKDDYAPGTQNRVLTISGDMKQVQAAYIMVDEKLAQVEPEFDYPFRQSHVTNN